MTRRGRGGRDGYILVAVLAVAVMLTGLLAAGSLVVRSGLGAARTEDADIVSAGLLSSGIEIAAYQLTVLRIRPDLVDGRRIRLSGGTVTPHVIVEAGKVDLNAADPKLLAGVLSSIGMDEGTARSVLARIVELRGPTNGTIPDGDAAPSAPAGAEPRNPGIAAPANGVATGGGIAAGNTPPKRRGLQSVEDLRDIEGVTRDDMRHLREMLTVYNTDGRLDIMTASPEVLGAIPGMTKLKLTQVLAARESGSENAAHEAQSALDGDLASFAKAVPGPAYTIRIDADDKSGRKKSAEAVVAASKSPNQPYYILDWRE